MTGIYEPLSRLTTRREGRVGSLHRQADIAADERQRVVGTERSRQEPGLAEHLEAVADAEDEAAVVCERPHRSHDGGEPRDRAAAEVVAVREAAGEHDGLHTVGKSLVGMPDERRLGAELLERTGRVAVVVRAGEDDDGNHA